MPNVTNSGIQKRKKAMNETWSLRCRGLGSMSFEEKSEHIFLSGFYAGQAWVKGTPLPGLVESWVPNSTSQTSRTSQFMDFARGKIDAWEKTNHQCTDWGGLFDDAWEVGEDSSETGTGIHAAPDS